jgi:cyclopropane fatty-acyl-phospholipid synthase-like methyltransferase
MKAINRYYEDRLTREDIQTGKHRQAVGGLWQEIGELQFGFLVKKGLQTHHRLLDVGCGALRGGIHFIRYLDPSNYYGVDLNESLIEAGRHELKQAELSNRDPHLLVTNSFELHIFGVTFDYVVAISLFTHLPMNHIIHCLHSVAKVLVPHGVFFATFFQAASPGYFQEMTHYPGGVITRFDSDPFHYSLEEMEWMSRSAGLKVELIGPWDHPRDQRMLAFTPLRFASQ